MVDKNLPKPWPEAHGFNPRDRELVEVLWDNARTARLSELYYGERLDRLSRWNFIFELLVAIGASGSGIAGWAVWQDKIGAVVWACIAGLAAVIAIAKPLLAIDRRIRHATRQQQLYRSILSSLENLAFDIQQAGTLSAENRRRYQRARENLRQAEDADDPAQNLRRLEQLQQRVDKEMPAHSLWVPLPAPEAHPA
nr:hypothetical protein [uncultured Rhodopila sp.]